MTSSIFSEVGVGGMTLTFEFIADDGEREPEEEVEPEDEDGWKKMLVSNLKMLFNNLTLIIWHDFHSYSVLISAIDIGVLEIPILIP